MPHAHIAARQIRLQPSAICSRSSYVPLRDLPVPLFLSCLALSLSLSVRGKNKISENLQLSGCSSKNDAAASSRRPSTKMFMHFFWSLTVLKVFRILLLLRRRRRRRCVNCMRTKIDEYARRRRARAMPPQLVAWHSALGGGRDQGTAGGNCVRPKTTQKCACRQTCCIRIRCRQLRVVSPMPWQAYRMPPGWLLAIWTTTT